mmetsp:Transcript_2074/g.5555  ORF Transcript_2074/g.5555 Transcript_2074/m.5555 type:complete len:146 (-) Transcript_2074:53-490(-)
MSCAKNAYQPSSRDPSCRGKIAESSSPPALDGRRRELGDAHPSTLSSINNLALFLKDQGKYADAEPLYREALDGFRRELGDAHPHYGDTCKFYAEFFEKQAMFSEAASYYDQAAHAYEQSYGADHEETRDARTKADACRSKAADA